MTPGGLPHSDIRGSKPASGSPRRFAGCCVLLRLSVPRHPPCALANLPLFRLSLQCRLLHHYWCIAQQCRVSSLFRHYCRPSTVGMSNTLLRRFAFARRKAACAVLLLQSVIRRRKTFIIMTRVWPPNTHCMGNGMPSSIHNAE